MCFGKVVGTCNKENVDVLSSKEGASAMNTFRVTIKLGLVLVLLTLTLLIPSTTVRAADSPLDLQNAMRKLWEDHITWTRLYIISVAGDLPDKDPNAQRLLQNQEDIGNAVRPLYGDDAAN